MTKGSFNEFSRQQIDVFYILLASYSSGEIDVTNMRGMAHDLRLVAKKTEELCDVYEMENKVK